MKLKTTEAFGWLIVGICGLVLPLVPGIVCICYACYLFTNKDDEQYNTIKPKKTPQNAFYGEFGRSRGRGELK